MREVELSARAAKDLRKVVAGQDRERLLRAMKEGLTLDQWPPNLDVKTLKGAEPWMRMRVGDWRILFRQVDAGPVLVARVVNRKQLEEAVRTLKTI
ncbi:MAG: type II toxin-antitoxin system RelE/ParE family toxin [Actinomycetota bacterium]